MTPDAAPTTAPGAPSAPHDDARAGAALIQRGPQLAVVVPTFNERGNIVALTERIATTLRDVDWELIFVDDNSPDGTADAVRALTAHDARVRCIQRVGRRGLSSACIEGMLATSAPYVAVMDADLQHDERILPQLLTVLRDGEADIAIGSRYVAGGSIGNFPDDRQQMSRLATRVALAATKVEVADPMSGFFMLRAELLRATVHDLSGQGFKILLDLLASVPAGTRVREVPYRFGERLAGESKLDTRAAWDYGVLLLDKTIGRYIPTRFLLFSAVGALGLGVHMVVLALLYKTDRTTFIWGQAWATLVAMSFNFALNNELTYRDRRLRGAAWLRGWATFVLACSLGAAANIGIAEFLYERDQMWALSAIAGVLVGAVWNYAVTSIYTWRTRS
jgi:dolichol-phosphate mannosyltransferase